MLINTSLAVDGDIDCRRTCSCPWSRPALLECWSTPLRFCILAAGPPSRCRISPWLLANTSVQMRKGVVCFHCSRETEAQWIQLTLNHTKKQNWIDSGCSESGTYFTPPPVPTPACVPSNGGGAHDPHTLGHSPVIASAPPRWLPLCWSYVQVVGVPSEMLICL